MQIGGREAMIMMKTKKYWAVFVLAILTLGLAAAPAFGQASGTVKGVCRDAEGTPVGDALVVYQNTDNGQKYTLKTNKKGEYFSLGITPGNYNVALYKTADDLKANKDLFHISKYRVNLDENNLDIDLKKEQEAAAKGQGMSAEDLKKMQEQNAKATKEKDTVKALNEKLQVANTAMQGQDYEAAITALNDANQIDATRDLIWFKLGDAYRLSAPKQTDPAEKQKRLDSAIEAYQKAIQMRTSSTEPQKDPAAAAKTLAAYYNNEAEAYAKANKTDDAVKTYALAAQTDPTAAAQYYFNTGAVLTNAGKVDDAIVAFDKVIAADPNRAAAYYWKGVNLIGKATLQGDKMVAPPNTAESFQKYLELEPTGTYADAAKQMLASIGATVETGFGNKKKPATKK